MTHFAKPLLNAITNNGLQYRITGNTVHIYDGGKNIWNLTPTGRHGWYRDDSGKTIPITVICQNLKVSRLFA